MNSAFKKHLLKIAFRFTAAFIIGLVIGCTVAALSAPEDKQPEPPCTPGCICDSSYITLLCPEKLPPKEPHAE